jgi:hypothetical protein
MADFVAPDESVDETTSPSELYATLFSNPDEGANPATDTVVVDAVGVQVLVAVESA